MAHALRDAGSLAKELLPGAYFTDGAHLFAVIAVSAGRGSHRLVTIEDCLTLELVGIPLRELERANFSLVRPAPSG